MSQVDRRNSGGIMGRAAYFREWLEVGSSAAAGAFMRLWSPKKSQCVIDYFEEEVTLATGGVTTDTTGTIPAHSIVLGVATYCTTAVTTAINFDVGIAGSTTLYATNSTKVAAGDVDVHADHLAGAAIFNATAAAIRLTTDANPGAGAIRVTVWYIEMIEPTS